MSSLYWLEIETKDCAAAKMDASCSHYTTDTESASCDCSNFYLHTQYFRHLREHILESS